MCSIVCLLLLAHICVQVMLEESPNATCGKRCCQNYYNDKFNGSCVACPHGTYGLNCNGTCPPQFYGQFCLSKCECPLNICNKKYGCLEYETKNGDDDTWKYVAFSLIGSITTMVVVGRMILKKSSLGKKCTLWREINVSNENETEHTEEEHRYERRRSLQSMEEIEHEQPRGQAEENNYTDLRRSALFPIYDNPDERMPGPNSSTTPSDAAKSLAILNLSIDDEDDSSEEGESEDEGYGQLFKHEMYNVLSLRKTYPDKFIHVRPVSDDTMINTSSKETQYGYQSIQLATSKVPEDKVKTSEYLSRSLSEKATIRQSLISETIEEYIQTSKVTRNLNGLEDEDKLRGTVITNYKSQTVSTGIDQPSKKNTRPYSLAKTSWSSDLTQDKIPIAESIDEDDENEYDDVDNEDDDVDKKGDENEYDDVNKEDNMNQDGDADKDGVNNDNDGNDDDPCEKSRPIIQNTGIESKENGRIQKSCREAECKNQPEKTTKNEEFPVLSLTDSLEDYQEYTQVIKKRMLLSTENEISEKNPVEVDPLLPKKTGFSSDEKVLSELSGSRLVGTDEVNLKGSGDKDTSENDISDITYRLINITNL